MDDQLARTAYAILVDEVGASTASDAVESFVLAHTTGPVDEYRFCGDLGFGGKFWSADMRVSCYREDDTPDRRAAIDQANTRLRALVANRRANHQPTD